MNTPEETSRAIFNQTGEYVSPATIKRIQHDARKGMVPQDDVLELLLPVTKALQHAGDITHENHIGWALQAIEAFESKHPNLFTK